MQYQAIHTHGPIMCAMSAMQTAPLGWVIMKKKRLKLPFYENHKICTRTCNWHRDHRRGCSNNIIMVLPGVDCLRKRRLAELCLQLFAHLPYFISTKIANFFKMLTALMKLIGLNNTFCSVSQVFTEWFRKLKKKVFIVCTVQYTCMLPGFL
jgi:hypothetical protein